MQAESITVFVGGRNSKQRKITKHLITIIISQFSKKAETKFWVLFFLSSFFHSIIYIKGKSILKSQI